MNLITVRIEKPENVNLILGQAHFIKTVEDLHEAIACGVPNASFGLAFCESSGPCLVRWSGTNHDLVELAKQHALQIGAGHSFLVFLENCYPINVLPAVRQVPEVCRIYCATANPVEVVLAETTQGRGILGVIDGHSPKGVEQGADIGDRHAFLRRTGYKL